MSSLSRTRATGAPNPLGGTLDTTDPWTVNFWLGAWDPDVLCLFVKGALEVPYLTTSG